MLDSCTPIRDFVNCSICLKLNSIVVIQQLKKGREVRSQSHIEVGSQN